MRFWFLYKFSSSEDQTEQVYLQVSLNESKVYSATPSPSFLINTDAVSDKKW